VRAAPITGACSHVAVSVVSAAPQRLAIPFLSVSLLIILLQGQCHSLRAVDPAEKIVVVHAYADGPYDRSSFHLAGQPSPVVAVASELIKGAIQGLSLTRMYESTDEVASRHPFVGIVDHVSVMPLGNDTSEITDGVKKVRFMDSYSWTGSAAREIGSAMDQLGVEVHYYGDAHPNKTPLATVRREQTSFFRSGGLNDSSYPMPTSKAGVATVGAPPSFVENYNVRLLSDKKTARSLTKTLRERDGGLLGVEALTLPYGEGMYEVACNLLRPDVGSAEAIHIKVKEWAAQQREVFLEKSYRVGTTVDQCLEAVRLSDSIEDAIEYDEAVMDRLRENLDDSY